MAVCANENGMPIMKFLLSNASNNLTLIGNVTDRDKEWNTPLIYACRNKNGLEIVKFLIEGGVFEKFDVSHKNIVCSQFFMVCHVIYSFPER